MPSVTKIVPSIAEVKTIINETLKINILQVNRVVLDEDQLSFLLISIKQKWTVTLNSDRITNEIIPGTNRLGKVITLLSLFELISKTIRNVV